MKTILEAQSTPRQDGFWMPGEYEPQTRIWMLWPNRPDNWRNGAKPAQQAFAEIARAIAQFEPVIIGAKPVDYAAARYLLGDEDNIKVIEMEADDSWIRDCGPTFVINATGAVRAVHWHFNAWGGLVDGLYFPWDKDALVGVKVADLADVDRYRPESFILEGGSIHADGEGTLLTTEMCLLSEGRNPDLTRAEIEGYLSEYLGIDKVIWIKDGIDPEETNGHVDDVACFVAPGEVACIWTEDPDHPFYEVSQQTYAQLSETTDARGRLLKVHKLCVTKEPIYMTAEQVEAIDLVEGTIPRTTEDPCITSYMNFLIVNGGVIVPQYDDPHDSLALDQIQAMFPNRKIVGVQSREVVFGGGNIHCITQQQPAPR
ncbi:MAG: agmatine deiminase [Propionibacteriaceae bacterium]|jgi:agmatine deiminase|nr:agmatine deiminase [Propionibacteriaceae bacterium]